MSGDKRGRWFDRFSTRTSELAGSSTAFALAGMLVLLWLVEGVVSSVTRHDLGYMMDPQYSLQINSPTTIVTFLLLFLVQGTQNRNDKALHLKLDALIDASDADNDLAAIEQLDAKELAALHERVEATIASRVGDGP